MPLTTPPAIAPTDEAENRDVLDATALLVEVVVEVVGTMAAVPVTSGQS
jgi:hypothetical protein